MKNSKALLAIFVVWSCLLLIGCSNTNMNTAPTEINSNAAIPQETEDSTFFYHDNNPSMWSSPLGDGSSEHTPKIAVKFTPESYPLFTKQVQILMSNETGKEQLFNLYAYQDKEGLPDETNELFNLHDLVVPQTTGELVSYDLPLVPISEGSIWLVIEWQEKPLKEQGGDNSFRINVDSSLDHPDNHLFFRNKDGGWMEFPSVSSTLGDAFVTLVLSN